MILMKFCGAISQKFPTALNSKENIAKLIRFAFSYNWMYAPALIGSWSKIKRVSK